MRIARSWRSDPLCVSVPIADRDVLTSFLSACAFLVSLCRCLIIRIAERGRRGREESFAHYGPMQYLVTLGAA